MYRCLIIGSGSGANQIGYSKSYQDITRRRYVAIYNCGAYGSACTGQIDDDHINIGIEQANAGTDLRFLTLSCAGRGRNIKLGGTNGYIANGTDALPTDFYAIENYNGYGEHRKFFMGGYSMRQAMPDGADVLKNNFDDVLKIVPNISGGIAKTGDYHLYQKAYEAKFKATTDSKTYSVAIFNRACGTLNGTTARDHVYIQVEYLKVYDDGSEYLIDTQYSTETSIANAASSSDWDTLSVTGIAPAAASIVRVSVYHNLYHATGMLYVEYPRVS
jgi:hypothetical protein